MSEELQKMYKKIDQVNQLDKRMEVVDGIETPKELIYGIRMSDWLERLYPDANEAVAIAARGQHIARWEIPRNEYPSGKAGYYKWRTALYTFHGEKLAELMEELDFNAETVRRVKQILLKKDLKTNFDTQFVEDVASLVFLSFYLDDFASRNDMNRKKLVDIIQKTWQKMSKHAQETAKTIAFSAEIGSIVQEALVSTP